MMAFTELERQFSRLNFAFEQNERPLKVIPLSIKLIEI